MPGATTHNRDKDRASIEIAFAQWLDLEKSLDNATPGWQAFLFVFSCILVKQKSRKQFLFF
jgi:hypothetical protein